MKKCLILSSGFLLSQLALAMHDFPTKEENGDIKCKVKFSPAEDGGQLALQQSITIAFERAVAGTFTEVDLNIIKSLLSQVQLESIPIKCMKYLQHLLRGIDTDARTDEFKRNVCLIGEAICDRGLKLEKQRLAKSEVEVGWC